jgi:hypothetical protein
MRRYIKKLNEESVRQSSKVASKQCMSRIIFHTKNHYSSIQTMKKVDILGCMPCGIKSMC